MNLAKKPLVKKRTIPAHEMQMRQLISHNFQRLMEKHGMDRNRLCAEYPCNTSYVSQIINCSTSISLQALYKWALIFNENVVEFFRPQRAVVVDPLIDKMLKHPDSISLVEAVLDAHINSKTVKKVD